MMISFAIGLSIGAAIGFLTAAMLAANGDDDMISVAEVEQMIQEAKRRTELKINQGRG